MKSETRFLSEKQWILRTFEFSVRYEMNLETVTYCGQSISIQQCLSYIPKPV